MRNIRLLFCCFFLSTFLVSCEKDNVDYGLDAYEERLATVCLTDNKIAFLTDDEELLFDAGTKTFSNLAENQRVYMNYTFLPETTPGFDRTVRVNWVSKTSGGKLESLNAVKLNSLPNDPVDFESIWIGSHYLNLIFSIEYKSQPHKIILATDSSQLNKNEYIYIVFRHDKNNDDPGYKSRVIASYDLEKLLGKPLGTKKLHISVNTENYGEKVYELDY